MIENIRLSFQGIWSHKMRSFLTMLGIIIGIASIISIVSTIKARMSKSKRTSSAPAQTRCRFSCIRAIISTKCCITACRTAFLCVTRPRWKNQVRKNVEDAAFYTSRSDYNNSVYYGNNGISGSQVFGVDNSYFTTNGLVLKSGRTFVDSDLRISTRQPSSMPIRRIRCLTAKTPSEKRSRSAAFRLRWLAL